MKKCKCGKTLLVPTWKYCEECSGAIRKEKLKEYHKKYQKKIKANLQAIRDFYNKDVR